MSEFKKHVKGITLIALVVTIIVLLILAGVTIGTLTGENGMLTRAKLSKNKTEEAVIREEVEFAVQEILLDKGYKEEITISKMAEYLAEKLEGIIIVEIADSKIKIEYKGYEIEIEDTWKVKLIGKAGITVTYTTEPKEYTKNLVEIIMNVQTKEGVEVSSITPQNNGVEVIEENIKFKVTENAVYQFRLVDNSNNERTIQVPIDNIDRQPANAEIEIVSKPDITQSEIKAKLTIKDDKSGVDLDNCAWVLKEDETPVGTDIASYTGGKISKEEGEIETGTITKAGTYYIHILATDKLGNTKEYCSEGIEIKLSVKNKWNLGIEDPDFIVAKGIPDYKGKDEGVYLNNAVLSTKDVYTLNNTYTILFEGKNIEVSDGGQSINAGYAISWGEGGHYHGSKAFGVFWHNDESVVAVTGYDDSHMIIGDKTKDIYDNQWNIFAIKFDGEEFAFFINDKKIGTSNVSSPKNTKLYVGGLSNSPITAGYTYFGYANGYYRNLAIYDEALSDDIIQNYKF